MICSFGVNSFLFRGEIIFGRAVHLDNKQEVIRIVSLCIMAENANSPTHKQAGPNCSKLTTQLVNVLSKFQKLISEMCPYFLVKKCVKLLHCKSSHFFHKKKISVFGCKVVKCLTS